MGEVIQFPTNRTRRPAGDAPRTAGSLALAPESIPEKTRVTFDYDAFGTLIRTTGATVDNPYLFTGERYDAALGLYYLRARYMEPGRARFWTMDSFEGTDAEPASLHKYLYAHGNPVNKTDPSGEFVLVEVLIVTGIIGVLVGKIIDNLIYDRLLHRDPTANIEAQIIIWDALFHWRSLFGHASVVVDNISYSWNSSDVTYRADPAIKYISSNLLIRSGKGFNLNISASERVILKDFYENYKGEFDELSNNCSGFIVDGLRRIGIDFSSCPNTPDALENDLLNSSLVSSVTPYKKNRFGASGSW